MWKVNGHWLDTEGPIIRGLHTYRDVSKVWLWKGDAARLAVLGDNLAGNVLT